MFARAASREAPGRWRREPEQVDRKRRPVLSVLLVVYPIALVAAIVYMLRLR
jgi:hypothetical protein